MNWNRPCRIAAVVGAVGVLVFAVASGSGAQEPGPSISVSVERSSRAELADVLAARLADPDGKPISEARLRFWIRADMLGERFALVGEAITDSSGVARLPFVPHKSTYPVRVTFDGNETWGPVEGIASIEFSSARVVEYREADPTQLGSLRFVMPRLMGIVLMLIWMALLGLAVFTLRSVKRLSHDGKA